MRIAARIPVRIGGEDATPSWIPMWIPVWIPLLSVVPWPLDHQRSPNVTHMLPRAALITPNVAHGDNDAATRPQRRSDDDAATQRRGRVEAEAEGAAATTRGRRRLVPSLGGIKAARRRRGGRLGWRTGLMRTSCG